MNDLEIILLQDDVVSSIKNNIDYLLELIPEIKEIIGFDHKHPHHHLNVWDHTLLSLSLSENDFDVRLSVLLHDIGKPAACEEGEVRHYKGHPKESSKISRNILKRLKYDDNYINYICYLIEHHDTPMTQEQVNDNYEMCLKLYEIQRCDALAHHPDKLEKRKEYLAKTKKLFMTKS